MSSVIVDDHIAESDLVHDGNTVENSEVGPREAHPTASPGSDSEPQGNLPSTPNTAMTLVIKVEKARDLYVSSRRDVIKSRLFCADILINDSDTPEFVTLVNERNPAGEHAATKIIS